MQPRFGNRTTARRSRTRGTAAVSKIRCATRKTKTWRRPDRDSQLRPRRLRLHFVLGLRRGSFGVGELNLRSPKGSESKECASSHSGTSKGTGPMLIAARVTSDENQGSIKPDLGQGDALKRANDVVGPFGGEETF